VGPTNVRWFKPIQTRIQTNLNLTQIIFKFDRPKNYLPELKKFGIKYGCEGLEERNNCLPMNFSRLVMEIELKIWEIKF
jgi:hypothetical protein